MPIALIGAGVSHAAPAPSVSTSANENVISYPAEFFSSFKPNTASDMILRLPGFTLDDGSSVRGFGGAAGNVLIDGQRPTSKADDLIAVLQRIPAPRVARIDVIRGATPGIDMQGKTLVANVVLRKTGGFSGVATGGIYNVRQGYHDPNARLEASWRRGNRSLEGSLFAATGHLNTEGSGPHEILGPHGQLLDRSNTHNSEPTFVYKATAAGETPLAGGDFRANLTFEATPYDLTSVDIFRIEGREEEQDHQTQKVGELGLHFAHDLTKTLQLEAIGLQQLSQSKFRSTFQTSVEEQKFRLDNRQSESVGRAVLHWQPSVKLTGEAGGEFAYNKLNAQTDFRVNGAVVALPAANVRVTEGRGEAFANVTWRALNQVSLEAGLRVESSTISGSGDVESSRRLTFAKPRAVATWSPDNHNQVRIRVEREVGQLAFDQFVATASLNSTGIVAGNPNLLPQRDWVFEAAYEHHFWEAGVVSLTFRHLNLSDVIDRAPVFASSGTFDTPANIGGGVETDVIAAFGVPLARLGFKGLTVRGNSTWRKSAVTDPTTGATRRISGQHPLDAEIDIIEDIPKRNLSVGIQYYAPVRERYFRFNEIDSNATSSTADIYVDYKPRPNLAFRLQVFTVTHYNVSRTIFGGPRNLAQIQSFDIQKRSFGPLIFFRVRRTF